MSDQFKTLLKKVDGNKGAKCFYPVRMDTYGRGCQFGCHYCYAHNILHKWGEWQTPVPIDIKEVEQLFHTVFETDRPHRFREHLIEKKRIRLGGMCDVFMPQEKELGITHKFLQLLSKYDIPYLIVTKSDLIATPKYMSVLRPDLANIQFTVSSLNKSIVNKIEPGAPESTRRLAAMETLRINGFDVALRVAPIILDIDGYFDFKSFQEMLRYKPRTAIIEFLRLSNFINKNITCLDKSLYPLFHANYWFLEPDFKYKICKEIRDVCLDKKVDFTICEEETEMYERSKALWSNPNNCCNLPERGWK